MENFSQNKIYTHNLYYVSVKHNTNKKNLYLHRITKINIKKKKKSKIVNNVTNYLIEHTTEKRNLHF